MLNIWVRGEFIYQTGRQEIGQSYDDLGIP